MNQEEYIALLLERQAEWITDNPGRKYPPLLEWFVRAGDLEKLNFKV